MAFFELRADFWIDDQKVLPDPGDHVQAAGNQSETLAQSGLLQIDDVDRLLKRMRSFLAEHQKALLARYPDLGPQEKEFLGIAEPAPGGADHAQVEKAIGSGADVK